MPPKKSWKLVGGLLLSVGAAVAALCLMPNTSPACNDGAAVVSQYCDDSYQAAPVVEQVNACQTNRYVSVDAPAVKLELRTVEVGSPAAPVKIERLQTEQPVTVKTEYLESAKCSDNCSSDCIAKCAKNLESPCDCTPAGNLVTAKLVNYQPSYTPSFQTVSYRPQQNLRIVQPRVQKVRIVNQQPVRVQQVRQFRTPVRDFVSGGVQNLKGNQQLRQNLNKPAAIILPLNSY